MRSGYWDRGIAPAEHDGEILRLGGVDSAMTSIDARRSTLILARCKYSVLEYEKALRRKRLPYAWVSEESGTQAKRAFNAYYELEKGRPVYGEDLACAIAMTPANGVAGVVNLRRGVKASWERQATVESHDMVLPSQLESIGMTSALIERIKSGRWCELLKNAERWRNAAEIWGAELATEPAIRIGTIHASKGMEADDVVLCTTTSRRTEDSQVVPEIHDEERRVEYVGVTRARKRLMISQDMGEYRMRLPL